MQCTWDMLDWIENSIIVPQCFTCTKVTTFFDAHGCSIIQDEANLSAGLSYMYIHIHVSQDCLLCILIQHTGINVSE